MVTGVAVAQDASRNRSSADEVRMEVVSPGTLCLTTSAPGIMVPGHYMDLARCQTDTKAMGPGVELVEACAPK